MATNKLQTIRHTFEKLIRSQRFDRVLQKVLITSAENGKVTAEMIVSEEHANRSGTLHGGMTATLVDQISTLALTTVDESGDENMQRGVSVDMSISFLRPAKIGETIEVTANILKKGRTLAFLDVNICDKNSGKLIAKGNHTKYL